MPPMRFLADENIPFEAVEGLRQAGHDVVWIRTDRPGSPDPTVLALAAGEKRILLTFDKDFGELAFRHSSHDLPGIILFRIHVSSATAIARFISSLIGSRTDWHGQFAVVEDDRLRMRPLKGH
jgi:predicted nuclease of predicted toxin-antitoxin system